MARLFNHLVGYIEQVRGDGQIESFSCLKVDDELDFGRLLDGKIRWLRTLHNPVNIESGAFVTLTNTNCIVHKAAALSNLNRLGVDRRQFVACREFGHSSCMNNEYALGRGQEALDVLPASGLKRSSKIVAAPNVLNQ